MPERCPSCGNHALTRLAVAGAALDECEMCGELFGPADIIELLELQREAENLGCSPDSYPLARFLQDQPGVKVLADFGGSVHGGKLPFVSFELTDRRITQVENLGQTLSLLRNKLECRWTIEYAYEFQPGFELRPARDGREAGAQVEAARRDLGVIWRALRQYSGLGWWRRPSGRLPAQRR